jgi:hypothetical protein
VISKCDVLHFENFIEYYEVTICEQ